MGQFLAFLSICFVLGNALPAWAQVRIPTLQIEETVDVKPFQPDETPQSPKTIRKHSGQSVSYTQYPLAILQTLDKVTARTGELTVRVGEPFAVGPLYAVVQTCQETSPIDPFEAAAFIQVWEPVITIENMNRAEEAETRWVFSGWMFASSPALSAMDHAVYDIWVKECTSPEEIAETRQAQDLESDPKADEPAP